jgi:sugar/nucleoside kinase (ribokinase family)
MIPKILTVGHACLDIIHMVPRIPLPNTKVSSKDVKISIGGNAANAAVALQQMGANADLCTIVGSESHPFTRILISLLISNGVGINWCYYDETEPCSNSTIMVTPDGERTIMNWQGPNVKSLVTVPSTLNNYQMILGDTYRLPLVQSVFQEAKKYNIPTMLDVDAVFDDIDELPRANHVWFSQEAWRNHKIPLDQLQEKFGGIVGVTDGDRPVVWMGPDKSRNYFCPPQVVAINTLGAGDVFRARLGLGICLGENTLTAVQNACDAASNHITNKPLHDVFDKEYQC